MEDLELDGEDEFGVSLGEVSSSLESMGVHILDAKGSLRDLGEVIEEVGSKWNSGAWSDAEKQALAIDLAGKRQYNNLFALFENWEMYNEAVDTSINSVGTLQHQQDIYMESTEAKLQTLKTTWQDLYDSLIDTDEVNSGIDALTNLVQVFDNFIDSFGGGSKTILAFGTLVANIFNKQISKAITQASLNSQKYSDNINLLKRKLESIKLGVATDEETTSQTSSTTNTGVTQNNRESNQTKPISTSTQPIENKPQQQEQTSKTDPLRDAKQKELEVELEYAKKIREVRAGIDSDQYNELVDMQQRAGQLEYEATLIEQTALQEAKKVGLTEDQLKNNENILEDLSVEVDNRSSAVELTKTHTDEVKKQLQQMEIFVKSAKEYQDLVDIDEISSKNDDIAAQAEAYGGTLAKLLDLQIRLSDEYEDEEGNKLNIQSKVSKETKDELDALIDELGKTDHIVENKEEVVKLNDRILNLLIKINNEEKKAEDEVQGQADAAENYQNAREEAEGKRQEGGQIEQDFNDTIDETKKAVDIGEKVTMVTSSLSAMTTAWGTVNSVLQTWNDETASFGDKITQIVSEVGMAIPMLVSSFSNLSKALGTNSTILDVITTRQKIKNAQDVTELGITGKITRQTIQQNIVQTAKNNGLQAENLSTKAVIKAILEKSETELAQLGLSKAQTVALERERAAQEALNTSILKSPWAWVLGILTAVTAAISAYSSHLKEAAEKRRELNQAEYDAAVEEYDTSKEESDATTSLYQNYVNMKSKLDDSEESKENLKAATEELCEALGVEWDILDKIQGKYDEVNQRILEQQKLKTQKTIEEAQQVVATTPDIIGDTVEENIGGDFSLQTITKNGKKSENVVVSTPQTLFSGNDKVLESLQRYIFKEPEKFKTDSEAQFDATGGIFTFKEGVTETEAVEVLREAFEYISAKEDISPEEKEESTTYNWLKDIYNNSDVKELLNKNEEAETAIEDSIAQLADLTAQSYSKENDISQIKTTEDLDNYKESYIEQLKKSMTENGIDITEYTDQFFNDLANEYLSGFENVKTVLDQQEIKNEFTKQVGTSDEAQDFLNRVESEGGLELLAQVHLDELNSVEAIQAEYEKIKSQTTLEDIQVIINAQSEINSEEGLSEDTRNALEEKYQDEINWEEFDLSTPIQQLEMLSQLQHENNEELMNNYDATIKAEEKRIALLNEYEEKQSIINKKDYVTGEIDTDQIEEAKDRIEEIKEELEDLDEFKITPEVDIEFDENVFSKVLGDTVDDILSRSEALKNVGELIGEGFIVAKENVEEFASLYPELLTNAQVLADGQIQLNSQVVQNKMASDAEVLRSDAKTTEGILENKLAQLDSEIAYYDVVIANLQGVIDGNIDKDTAVKNIEKAETEYKKELGITETTNEEKAAEAEVAASQQSTNKVLANLDMIGLRVAQVSRAYSEMLTGKQVQYNSKGGTAIGGGVSVGVPDFADTPDSSSGLTPQEEGGVTLEQQLQQAKDTQAGLKQNRAETAVQLSNLRSGGIDSKDIEQRAGSGGRSSGGSGGGGGNTTEKVKDPDFIEYLEDTADRYHDVNIELKQLDTNLNRLQKQQEKLTGKDLTKNLNEQLRILKKQEKTQKDKLGIAKDEAKDLKGDLKKEGATFDKDGTINNYAEVLQKKKDYVNSIIDKYNHMSAEEQEGFKKNVDKAKEDYEKLKDNLERYDELVSEEIPGIKDEIQDIVDQEIEIKIKKFTMKFDVKLDAKEAQRNYNTWKREVKKGISDDNVVGVYKTEIIPNMKNIVKGFSTNSKSITSTVKEINKMNKGKTSKIFGDDMNKALETLGGYLDEAEDLARQVREAQQQANEDYLESINKMGEVMQEGADNFARAIEKVGNNMDIIKLRYGDKAYDKLAPWYQQEIDLSNTNAETARENMNYAKQKRAEAEKKKKKAKTQEEKDQAQKEYDEWDEIYKQSEDTLYQSVEDSLQMLLDQYTNTVNLAFDTLNKKLTNGKGLDYMNEEWDLINKNADQYLDTVNSTYAIQNLQNKYMTALNQTDSLSGQKKLNAAMNEQLDILKKKDKLTQYDVDRANKMYDITLKQIALEEAQQNKSQMRLRRDAQGNYSYQYVADEDNVAKAQQDLLAAQNDLYNFDKEQYKQNLNQAKQYYEEFAQKYQEISTDMSLTEEERAEQLQLLRDQYQQLFEGVLSGNEEIITNLKGSAEGALQGMYDYDSDLFTESTGLKKEEIGNLTDEFMNTLVPQLGSGVQQLIDNIDGKGGLKGACDTTFKSIEGATTTLKNGWDELGKNAKLNFDEIAKGHDETIPKAQELYDLATKAREEQDAQVTTLETFIKDLDKLIKSKEWKQLMKAIENGEKKRTNGGGKNEGKGEGGGSGGGGGQNDDDPPKVEHKNNNKKLEVGDTVTFKGEKYYNRKKGKLEDWKKGDGKKATIIEINKKYKYPIRIEFKNKSKGWVKKSQISGYGTGGYTGDWTKQEGKLAFLHQKELVLRQSDTINMLKAVSVVRNVASLINDINSSMVSKLSGLESGFEAILGQISAARSDTLEQNVHIEASFPHVQNSKEIEEAFKNLVNVASQRAYRSRR